MARTAKTSEKPTSADAVVIGAGLGGLVCALEMQRNGLQVVMAEKRPLAGGYAHHFRRGSHRFDVALHHLGGLGEGGMTRKLLEPLGVLDLLDFERPEVMVISEFPDACYRIPNRPEEAVAYLGSLFPADRAGLERLFAYSPQLKNHVIGPILYRDFNLPMDEMLSMENVNATFSDLLSRFISSSRLKAVLGQLWMYLGLPSDSSTANFSNCVFASGFIEGGYHLKGGSEALVTALVERFRREGGRLLLKSPVAKIESSNRQTTGVILEDGSRIKTPYVAANASPLDIFPALVDADQLSPIFLHRLENMEPSSSAFATYIGLDCPPGDLGIPRGNSFINHGDSQEKAYRDCMEGRLEETDWCLTNSEDPALAPEGKGNLAIVEITSADKWMEMKELEYRRQKKTALGTLLNKYEMRYPGLKEHAEVVEFGTPRTLRRYSSNAAGALYGFAQIPAQANSRRISNRTPLEGLYLCGAWTQAGGGFEGAMMTGMKSAHMILEASGRDWNTGLEYREDAEPGSVSSEAPPVRPAPAVPASPGVPPSERPQDITAARPGTPPPDSRTSGEKRPADYSTPEYPFYHNTYQVYPDDTDFTGFAKDTAYLRFMDRARVRLMDQSEELRAIRPLLESYYVKLYSISAHIHNRAALGEKLDIQTGYKRATSHRAAVDQCILGSDGRTILTGRAEIMFITRKEELVELPAVYRTQDRLPFEAPEAALPPLLFADLSNHRFRTEFIVNYEDTDTQGVVYNVSYIKMAQKMFWEIKDEILPPGTNPAKIRCRHVAIRFMMPARLTEIIEVRAGYRGIDERSFGIDYRMTLKGSGTVLTDIHLEYTQD